MDLLFAHADDGSPFLDQQPDSRSAAAETERVETHDPDKLASMTGNTSDLKAQRWALVVPDNAAGRRLEAVVKPLVKQRAEDQQFPVVTIHVPPGMDADAAGKWKKNTFPREYGYDKEHGYGKEYKSEEKHRPRYLLILGDMDGVSLETQQALAGDGLPGRLVCPNERGYEAYVDKVLTWQRTPSAQRKARALFYTVHDGTAATRAGYDKLVQPCYAQCNTELRDAPAKFLASSVEDHGDRPDPDRFLELGSVRHPSVLLSMSHGMGPPRRRAWSPAEARALQGAMSFGSEGPLRPEDIAENAFLPGGVWFYFACFGAGVPNHSAYHHWLTMLAERGMQGLDHLQTVLRGLDPKHGFTSGLAQAALANPDGPLAVMSHVDLAWSDSYEAPGTGAPAPGGGRANSFFLLLKELLEHNDYTHRPGRVGAAMAHLVLALDAASRDLNDLYDQCKKEGLNPEGASHEAQIELGNLWMLRQDLRGYVLLGDPAVHLPLANAPQRRAGAGLLPHLSGAGATQADPDEPDVVGGQVDAARLDEVEEGILELASGERSSSQVSKSLKLPLTQVKQWERAYRDAGRRALQRLMLEQEDA
ncbi:hypothetical protein [Haliangium sp.]|uniref:hypothetical protein n=1 Tax=Haliangium sp. TaxID=2663208 RepID=UPI003D0CE95E